MNKLEKTYGKKICEATKKLKEINNTFSQATIDFNVKGSSSYDAFLWQKEIAEECILYIRYLGYIDSLLLYEKERMEWEQKFKDEEEYKEHTEKYNYYLKQRNKLIEIINSRTSLIKHFEFIKDIINNIPAKDNFNVLYNDYEINRNSLNLQIKFINEYNLGLMLNGFVDYKNITFAFENKIEELNHHKQKNHIKVLNMIQK